MPTFLLDSLDDDRVADYRALRDHELMRTKNLFVAEGRLVFERLVRVRRFPIRSVLVSATAHTALATTLRQVDTEVPIYVGSSAAFRDLGGLNMHRGCLALAERRPADSVSDLVSGARRLVVLDGLANPDNVGGVFRSAAAFGVDAVILDHRSCDPLYRKAIRTSMASALLIPFGRIESWGELARPLRAGGFTVVALTPRPGAQSLAAYVEGGCPERLALLFGAEGEGLSEDALAIADVHLRIPIRPEVDSLNVSVAAGIALATLIPQP